MPAGGKCPGSKEKRISGQERSDHQPCFDENDHPQDCIRPAAYRLKDEIQVFFHVKNKVNYLCKKVH